MATAVLVFAHIEANDDQRKFSIVCHCEPPVVQILYARKCECEKRDKVFGDSIEPDAQGHGRPMVIAN